MTRPSLTDARAALLNRPRAIAGGLSASLLLLFVPTATSGATQAPHYYPRSSPLYGTAKAYCSVGESGGYPLSGSYDNVYACGPVPVDGHGDTGPAIPKFWPITDNGGYQCTELAIRYLYVVTDGADLFLNKGNWNGEGSTFAGSAAAFYKLPSARHIDGHVSSEPRPGDIISEWGAAGSTAPQGDVGIVTSVTAHSINIVANNNNEAGTNTITMHSSRSWSINGGYYYYTNFQWITPTAFEIHPSVAARTYSPGEQDVFWKAGSGLKEEVWLNGFQTPVMIPGVTNVASAPAAAYNPALGEVDVYYRGTDGALWEEYWQNATWHGPLRVGMGTLGSDPTLAVDPNSGAQYIYWKVSGGGGLEGAVWSHGSFQGPFSIPGVTNAASGPAAAFNTTRGEIEVYYMGSNKGLWETYWNGKWNGPIDAGMGPLGTDPSVAVSPGGVGEQDVYWAGSGNSRIWEGWWNLGFHGPVAIPGLDNAASAPTAVVNSPRQQENVYYIGTDNALWETYWSGGKWYGPVRVVAGPIG